ncbi:MAG TPA: hypothetical protein VK797_24920 [Tepidisphaeraceae bacterium]|nr:hypothetical protein [Tepidisphaeraceae bacterium]
MKTARTIILVAVAFLAPVSAFGAAEPSLKDAYRKDFLIGSALGSPPSYSEAELALIRTQFDAATPEVCMKPRPIHPKEEVWAAPALQPSAPVRPRRQTQARI